MHKIEIRFFMILRLSACKIQHNFRNIQFSRKINSKICGITLSRYGFIPNFAFGLLVPLQQASPDY